MRPSWLLAALPLLATTAADPLAGRTAGTPTQCIDGNFANTVQIVDAHTILYRETDRRVWRTGPDGPCPGLEPLSTLIVEQHGSQLCRWDHFRVRPPDGPVHAAFCRFTAFTPFDKR